MGLSEGQIKELLMYLHDYKEFTGEWYSQEYMFGLRSLIYQLEQVLDSEH